MIYQPLDTAFFQLPVLELAKNLLGQYIVHERGNRLLVGRIVETEAYKGAEDRAAHSFSNVPTKRTKVMFDEAGYAYLYQMHTHTLFNVVGGEVGIPHAVLIRAVEPIVGQDSMRKNRGEHLKEKDWTNGPGKLTKALEITMDYYGHDLRKKPLYIAKGPQVEEIAVGPRVGIANSREAVHYPYRFSERGNVFVSKYRK